MKKNWTSKKLGEVCNLLNGFAFKSTQYVNDGIRVIRIANVQKGEIVDEQPAYYPLETQAQIEKYMLREGDILMSLTGNVGRVGILQKEMLPAALNQRVACLRFKGNEVLPRYIFHYLNSDLFEGLCIASARGIAQLNMSTDWLKEQSLPIPPLVDQELIVRELDAIHGILDKKQEQLRELDNLAQAIFYDMFGDPITNPKQWEVKKLGEVGENGLTYGSGASAVDFDGKVRYVRITDIREDGTLNDNIMSPNSIEDKYLLNEGDLLFARSGATVGKTYLHVKNDMDYIYAGYLIRLIPNKEIVNPLYLFHITKTQYYLEFIKSTQRAVAQPNINAKQYGDFSIPLPPLSLQQSFAAKIEAIEAQKQAVQQSIREVEALLAERMDYYFG